MQRIEFVTICVCVDVLLLFVSSHSVCCSHWNVSANVFKLSFVGLLNRIWFGNIWVAACSLFTNHVQSFAKKNKTNQCKNQHTQEKLKMMKSPLIFQLKKKVGIFFFICLHSLSIHFAGFFYFPSDNLVLIMVLVLV